MKEFGSDFHYFLEPGLPEKVFSLESMSCYADGRHAIQHLIICKRKLGAWKRIWMPEYFCYEVIDAIKDTGIEVLFYPDTPLDNDVQLIESLSFQEGDVLFRMNYFGLRGVRDNSKIPVEVIEDHSHDLLSAWALNSNANWCVASLRKTLPVPEGGVLWSPRGRELPGRLPSTLQNDLVSYKRLSAMLLKRLYLERLHDVKDDFRKMFIEGEQQLSTMALSGLSEVTRSLLGRVDIGRVYAVKKNNWGILKQQLEGKVEFLQPEDDESGTPFSFVLRFLDETTRDRVRARLVKNNVYCTVLWEIPLGQSFLVCKNSKKMLSIHCDTRYSDLDMVELSGRVLLAMGK